MSYTALYRKYRPATFADVKGQDAIVTTLRNQIQADRLGHAYLFCGTRGTGKTTIAKIVARAVNCEHPVDGNPCGECLTCRAIAAGAAVNVHEIDAASNNGVGDVREQIIGGVKYPPAEGRRTVFIIDEVHMLSGAAFNALLKTLEEPPEWALFILATTEAHKIPATILSRCQRYDFRRIPTDTILARLRELTETEGVEAEEKALRYIAKKADGGMRDALSLLDQCMAFFMGEKLTYENVLEVLGAVDTDEFSRLLRAIAGGRVPQVMRQLEELVMQGRDLTQFTQDFIWYLRSILLIQASADCADVLDVSAEDLGRLTEEAGMVRQDTLMRYIRILSELQNQLRSASSRRVLLEVTLLKMCCPEAESDEISVLERLRRIEKQLESGIPAAAPRQRAEPYEDPSWAAYGVEPSDAGEPEGSAGEPEPQRAAPEDLQRVMQNWMGIAAAVTDPRLKAVLAKAVPRYRSDAEGDDRLYIAFADFLGSSYLGREESKNEVEQVIAKKIGKNVEVKFVLEADTYLQQGTLSKIGVEEGIKKGMELINADIETLDE